MDKASIWIEASRPKTLFAGLCPVLIGTVLAIKTVFSLPVFFFSVLTALSLQIGTNLANDYFDFKKGADTEKRKGPRRAMQLGLVSKKEMLKAILLSFLICSLSTAYLIYVGGPWIAFLLFLAILLAVGYTAGPFSIAYLGLGDLVVFITFGPLAVAATYYLQTFEISSLAILAGLAPGFLSMAILVVNNFRDIEEDRLSRKKTLAVRFGKKFSQIQYATALLLGSLIVPIAVVIQCKGHFTSLISLVAFLPSIKLTGEIFRTKDPQNLNLLLEKTGKVLMLYTILFAIGWVYAS